MARCRLRGDGAKSMSVFVTNPQQEIDEVVLDVLPKQGAWSEEQYLWLTDDTNRLIEYTDGYLEVLPMPTDKHQTVLLYLYELFIAFLRPRGGKVLVAPLRIRIRPRKFREPDLLLVLEADDPRRQNRYWLGADLVLDVVSPDDPARDLVRKRADYAEAGIPEYWIVDPAAESITVLALADDSYAEHGVFGRGSIVTSPLLPGFEVPVNGVVDAE
jgi:Uma2 family endonuclease